MDLHGHVHVHAHAHVHVHVHVVHVHVAVARAYVRLGSGNRDNIDGDIDGAPWCAPRHVARQLDTSGACNY